MDAIDTDDGNEGIVFEVMPFDPDNPPEYAATVHVPAGESFLGNMVGGSQDYAEVAETARALRDMGIEGIVVRLWGQ